MTTAEELYKTAVGLSDKQEFIFSAELFLLRKIVETADDLILAKDSPSFCEASGGRNTLEQNHVAALSAYYQWLSDGIETN